jgi:hypothetical protein
MESSKLMAGQNVSSAVSFVIFIHQAMELERTKWVCKPHQHATRYTLCLSLQVPKIQYLFDKQKFKQLLFQLSLIIININNRKQK